MTYRESAPPADLATVVACTWHRDDGQVTVVPDGCVDLVWLAGRELVVAGADTGPRTVALPAGTRTSGVRLRTAAAGAVLGVVASDLRDRTVDLEDVWGGGVSALLDALRAGDRGDEHALIEAVRARRASPDRLVHAAAQELSAPGATVAAVAADLGVTGRTLNRRTLAAVGYGPKTLARVARLRRLERLTGPWAERALAAGYSSQAHMSDEVRRLTGRPPSRWLSDS
jgi:AraC-like DNA-binding protein